MMNLGIGLLRTSAVLRSHLDHRQDAVEFTVPVAPILGGPETAYLPSPGLKISGPVDVTLPGGGLAGIHCRIGFDSDDESFSIGYHEIDLVSADSYVTGA